MIDLWVSGFVLMFAHGGPDPVLIHRNDCLCKCTIIVGLLRRCLFLASQAVKNWLAEGKKGVFGQTFDSHSLAWINQIGF